MKAKYLSLFTYFTFKGPTDSFFPRKKPVLFWFPKFWQKHGLSLLKHVTTVYTMKALCVWKKDKKQTNLTITKKKKKVLFAINKIQSSALF